MPNRKREYAFISIVMVAAILRLYWPHHGLPDLVYVDGFKFVNDAREMVRSGDLHPRSFQNPGLFTYLLAASYKLTGAQSDFVCYLIARLWSALFGIAVVVLTYIGACQLTNKPGALTASALAACSPVLVSYSRLPVSDVVLSCFMLACLITLLRRDLDLKAIALAGLFAGLALGTKFSGFFLLPFCILVILLRAYKTEAPVPVVSGVATLIVSMFVTFVMTTPWVLVWFSEYWSRFAQEMHGQSFGQIGRIQLGYFDYLVSLTPTWEQPWLGTSILANEGVVILIAGVAATLTALSFRFGYATAIHTLFIIIYLAVVSQPGHLKAIRFVVPVLPSLFILCGWFAGLLLDNRHTIGRHIAHAAVGLILLSYPAYKSSLHVANSNKIATNLHARLWMKENIPADAKVLLSPFFINNLDGVTDTTFYLAGANLLQYRMPGDINANSELSPLFRASLLEDFRNRNIDYFVSNSWFEDAYSPVEENLRWFPNSVQAYAEFREALRLEGELVYGIRGHEDRRPGPDILIYRIKPGQSPDH